MTEAVRDLAHLSHIELLTPKPEESLFYFREILGMEVSGESGDSVYLRGFGDYERSSLKLTASKQSGVGHLAYRTYSPEALQRRVAALEAGGIGGAWLDGDLGHGAAYTFLDPDGHRIELFNTHYQVMDIENEPVRWDASQSAKRRWMLPARRQWFFEASRFAGVELREPVKKGDPMSLEKFIAAGMR